MTWTTQDVSKLKAAIASGQQSVRFGEREVRYQSTSAMLEALRQMEAEVAAVTAPKQATKRYHFTTLRGF